MSTARHGDNVARVHYALVHSCRADRARAHYGRQTLATPSERHARADCDMHGSDISLSLPFGFEQQHYETRNPLLETTSGLSPRRSLLAQNDYASFDIWMSIYRTLKARITVCIDLPGSQHTQLRIASVWGSRLLCTPILSPTTSRCDHAACPCTAVFGFFLLRSHDDNMRHFRLISTLVRIAVVSTQNGMASGWRIFVPARYPRYRASRAFPGVYRIPTRVVHRLDSDDSALSRLDCPQSSFIGLFWHLGELSAHSCFGFQLPLDTLLFYGFRL
ncbi:hypothetical protein EXIGLDRAFT_263184 [Exidia glandulosa HHB12029]|uniref:Uncharacterized protein n=1 Tax=Exidia glandulosa HHB12029 TaxID=1314781 RepID=A0A165DRM3_EXIGL|nr:hypothetical protein EXIGLDRAFT_263184 [Exidia glandulosa HHB12029]